MAKLGNTVPLNVTHIGWKGRCPAYGRVWTFKTKGGQ